MRTITKTGRGKHLFVDGSDPICAVILRPKSLRASEVAPVHIAAACTGRLLARCSRARTQRSASQNTDLLRRAHLPKPGEEMTCHY